MSSVKEKFDSLLAEIKSTMDFQKGAKAYSDGDYAVLLAELTPRAESGNADAQVILGMMYGWGIGVVYDAKKSAKWYHRATESVHARAQKELGAGILA